MAISWVSRTASNTGTEAYSSITHNGGRFVAVNNGFGVSAIMASSDGANWSNVGLAGEYGGAKVHWNGTKFLALSNVGAPRRCLTSPDGLVWTANVMSGGGFSCGGIAWNGATYVGAYDATGFTYTSPDGISWTQRTTAGTPDASDVIWTGTRFVMVGSSVSGARVSTSLDGITWANNAAASPNDLSCLAINGSTIVAMARTAAFAYVSTNDGATWAAYATGGVSQINSLAFGDGLFVAVGAGNSLTSPDGITWTSVPASQANPWADVAFGNGSFVAVSTTGTDRAMTTLSNVPAGSYALLTAPSPSFTASGRPSGYLQAAAPAATLIGFGGATAAIAGPQALLRAFGGATAVLAAPLALLSAAGHDSAGENGFAGAAPAATLAAFGGARATLSAPAPALAITGTFAGSGNAALTAPSPTLEADGRASGTGAAALRAPLSALVGYSGAVCSITVGAATLVASGTSGSVGAATLTAPLFELTASGVRQNSGRAALLAPSPRMGATAQAWLVAPGATLTAIGTAVVVATYEAYSINLSHKARRQGEEAAVDETTRYTNFPFTHIVRYQNSYFGVAADGLYLLEGTTDFALPTPTAIPYTVKTCIDDFKVPEKKSVASAHFGGRLGPATTVTLFAGETGQNNYAYGTPRGQAAQNHREKFGRGVKDRYFAIGIAGTGEMELDTLELETAKLNRRI